ncbi:MAG: hypothetical protein CVT98_07465 [Bacteroidetes bacterium HGW-Bacteroidetes-15]|nr:MAG: hypothetical protein CVT98_07465 [Bacteroidetes bacterium HGW-Bacteroidetes-15]
MLKLDGNERVLVCPLGWGLGHATRVITIVEMLLQKGCTVIVAADKISIDLLQPRFPNIDFIIFPSITIKLSKGKNQLLALVKIGLKVIFLTHRENRLVKKIIDDNKIDVVISDNRYGLYTKDIPSVLITHQLKIIFPKPFRWAMPIGVWFVKRSAERFTECWIPDNREGFRISGELSHPKVLPKNAEFIGLLSRFQQIEAKKQENSWDLVGIVSGPLPHREIFEKELVNLSNRLGLKALIIQGLPQELSSTKEIGSATLVPHLPDHEMAEAIVSAKYLICRSGYSTIMDLIALKRTALLVPTPGQTEQEYLANYLAENKLFGFVKQAKLNSIDISHFENHSHLYSNFM